MIRTIKLLGLTVTAALVASAMLAAGAQAAEGVFTSGTTEPAGTINQEETTIVGKQYGNTADNHFTSAAGSLSCEIGEYHGTSDGSEPALTITPHYTDCYKFSEPEPGVFEEENPATVTTNNCDYLFTSPDTIEGGDYTGEANLECENVGEEIVIHIYGFGSPTSHFFDGCTLSVEQFQDTEVGGHIVYDNTVSETKDDVTVEAEITDIPYTQHGACGVPDEPTTRKDATFTSTVTVTAEKVGGGEKKDATISD